MKGARKVPRVIKAETYAVPNLGFPVFSYLAEATVITDSENICQGGQYPQRQAWAVTAEGMGCGGFSRERRLISCWWSVLPRDPADARPLAGAEGCTWRGIRDVWRLRGMAWPQYGSAPVGKNGDGCVFSRPTSLEIKQVGSRWI